MKDPFKVPLDPEIDSRFKLLNSFEILVPHSYVHEKCFEDFEKSFGKNFENIDPLLNDSAFDNVAMKMKPGDRYEVKLFDVPEGAMLHDCYNRLEQENAVLLSAQALTFLYDQAKESLPVTKPIVSFGEQWALWVDNESEDYLLPVIVRFSDGTWGMYMMQREDFFEVGGVLACFVKK